MVKDKSDTTLVNHKKINALLEKDPTNKEILIEKLGCSSKTLERAKSIKSNQVHRINKDVVARLATHLKVNYSELVVSDDSKNLQEDINRTNLDKIYTINELFEKLNQSEVIENIYDCSVYEEITFAINNILEMAHKNNSENFTTINSSKNYGSQRRLEDEKQYLEILSNGNMSLNYLRSKEIDVYAGFYFINLIGSEQIESFDGDVFGDYEFWKPKRIKKGVILFSYGLEHDTGAKTIYPNKGLSTDDLYRIYNELLDMYKLEDKDYVLKYFFRNYLSIPHDEQIQYSEMPKMNSLPQLNSLSTNVNAELIKLVQNHLAINNNLNENELPKYNGIINSVSYITN